MKNVLVAGKKVDDVAGLYYELIKQDFHVENVAVDKSGTHVFLGDGELKDPGPIVETWLGKAVPNATRSLTEQRKSVNAEYQVKRAQKEAEMRAKAMEYGLESGNPAAISTPVITGPRTTLFSKIFRKLW